MVWYAEGLRFGCTGCGRCCTGAPGYVWVTEQEIQEMAHHIQLPIDLFYRRYVRRVGQRLSLIERRNGDCVFLRDGKLCEVYPQRPRQCRTFPFWPLALRDRQGWESLREDCEGIDHPDGKLYTAEEIERSLHEEDPSI